jgi:adenylate cyclase
MPKAVPEMSAAMLKNRALIPLRSAAAVLLAACVLLLSPIGLQIEEHFGLPLLFSWRGEEPPPTSVALVALDEESSAALALPDLDQLDRWPRSIHTRLLRTLAAKGVAVVAMDIAFLQPGDPTEDADLAAAMYDAGNVIILKMLDRMSADVAAKNTVDWQLVPLALFANNAAAVGAFTLPDQALKKYTTLFPRTPEGIEAAMPMIALQLFYRDASVQLLTILKKIGQENLAQRLEAEYRPAMFAAQVRAALNEQPALAKQLELAASQLADRNEAQRLRILLRAYQARDPVYLNFYGPQRTVPTVSLSEVLLHPDSPAVTALRGKAVFVGLSERFHKQRDYFFTAYAAGRDSRISGVEVAATLLANLQEDKLLHAMPPWQQILLLLLWGGLLVIATRRLTPALWLLLTVVLAAGYLFLAVKLFEQYSLWLPIIVPIAMATPALALLAIWYYYRRSAIAERAATEALSLYIPADIAASVGKNRQQLLNEHRQIEAVCLLTDIVGFTALSEQHEPAYMHELMNRYYRDVVAEVERHGGVVANIVGDGLLALWPITDSGIATNADNSGEKQAPRACRAALAIVTASDGMTTALGETLTTCVGIHFGAVSLGHLGAGKHFEYAPVGDAINTTSRVEAYNRQLRSRILISEPVHRWLVQFSLRSHGEVTLKGKREPLGLYELMADAAE